MLTWAVTPGTSAQTRSLALWLLLHAAFMAGSSWWSGWPVTRHRLPHTCSRRQPEMGVVRGAPGSGQLHDKPSEQHGSPLGAAVQANGLSRTRLTRRGQPTRLSLRSAD